MGSPYPVDMQLPVSGVHQGASLTGQPPGTCPDARNMRTVDLRGRRGVGRRDGLAKAVAAKAGSGLTSQRITGLSFLSKARAAPSGAGGNIEAVTQTFAGMTSSAFPGSLSVDTTSATSNGADLVYFTHSAISAASVSEYAGCNGVTSAVSGVCLGIDSTAIAGTGGQFPHGVAVNYYTTNDITATVETVLTVRYLDTATNQARWGPASEPCGIGPFIRGEVTLNQMIAARLKPMGTDQFQLEIVNVGSANPQAQIATSATQTIPAPASGTATQYTIRLFETTTGVTAILNWADASVSNLTVSATTSTYSGNYRAGVIVATDSSPGGSGGSGTISSYRKVKQLVYEKRVPGTYAVYKVADAADPSYASGSFYIPDGFRAIRCVAGGATTTTDGAVSQAGQYTQPCIDGTNDIIRTGSSSGAFHILADLDPTTSGPLDSRPGVDILPIVDFAAGTAPTQMANAAFRIADDSRSFNYMLHSAGAFSATVGTVATGVLGYRLRDLQVGRVVNGSDLGSSTNLSLHIVPMRETDRVRYTDDGTVLRVYINGMLLLSTTPTSAGTNRRCGGLLYENSADEGRCKSIRIVQGEGESFDLAETDPKVLVVTQGKFEIADIVSNTLTACTGSLTLLGSLPMAASFNNKFYVVDGTSTGGVIVDPIALTVSDWAATIGTAPWDDATIGSPRLVCTYRGRLVTARFAQNASLWLATRVFAPTDFSYGATPTRTAAAAGSNSDVGQPGDAITALMPFSDDYLYFGCASSIWMLEGDPGYNGAIQAVSYKTGVIGPRAFCFTERGDLYFMGTTGLFRMARGSQDPEPVGARTLPAYLDNIDSSATLVQLVYDGWKRHVHILLTPVNGTTAGVHVAYDIDNGAFWLDSYPRTCDPFSACEITGNEDEDRRFLIGGTDGYIRRPSETTKNDDGATTASWLRLAAIEAQGGATENLLMESQFTTSSGSGAVTWYWLKHDSADEVNAIALTAGVPASFSETGALSATAGFQTPVRHRIRGGAHQLVLLQSAAGVFWGLERAVAKLAPSGRRR